MTVRDVLILGKASPFVGAITERLSAEGHGVTLGEDDGATEQEMDPAPSAIVLIPPVPESASAGETEVEALLAALDSALVPAGLVVRDLVARRGPGQDTRIVVLSDGAATGPAGATAAAAVMGGMLGLARSWALELAPLGVSVNVVVIGFDPAGDGNAPPLPAHTLPAPSDEAVAHVVAFFLDPRAKGITGQVLSVCGGRLSGALPL